jgi:hypothetical protein
MKQKQRFVIGVLTRIRGRQSRRRVAGVLCYSACIADLRPVSWGPSLDFISFQAVNALTSAFTAKETLLDAMKFVIA